MKNFKYIFVLCISIFMFSSVEASSVNISANKSTITKGDSVNVSATISAGSPIYTTEGTLSCSGAGTSGSRDMGFEDMNTSSSSKSFSITLKPTSSGTITCKTSNVRLRELSKDKGYALDDSSISITVKEPVVVKKPTREYSSNNYLKDLTVEGYEISPKFDRNTLEYTVEVPNNTEKVKISASKEDSSSSISGDGEVSVSEGTNKIEIKVIAENGNERVYVINVNVKELTPIDITIDKKKYTIVRKTGVIDPPNNNYEESTIKIGNDDVLCYKNKKTNTTLVILKDDKGNAAYYIYDSSKKSYSKYISIHSGDLYINVLDMPKNLVMDGYSKKSFNYNNIKIEGYTSNNKDFYLIYGINELTGNKSLYVYDTKEGTIQRYNNQDNIYKDKADKYFLYFIIATVLFGISIITFSLILLYRGKRHKSKKIKQI